VNDLPFTMCVVKAEIVQKKVICYEYIPSSGQIGATHPQSRDHFVHHQADERSEPNLAIGDRFTDTNWARVCGWELRTRSRYCHSFESKDRADKSLMSSLLNSATHTYSYTRQLHSWVSVFYVLDSLPYRPTSSLVECVVREFQQLNCVYRNARYL
jgi:hypothetical protein